MKDKTKINKRNDLIELGRLMQLFWLRTDYYISIDGRLTSIMVYDKYVKKKIIFNSP